MAARSVKWQGVFPAATTQFRADQAVDVEATAAHLRRLVDAGVHGLVVLGTLGEATVLEAGEKRDVLAAAVDAADGRVPVLAGVAETSTAAACRFAGDAEAAGADGLMVLPALVYAADARESEAHFRAVARASGLPVMIYNNPVAYGVDLRPDSLAALADEANLVAVKESADDPRRLSDIVNATGERYRLFCGVDDLALEAATLGCVGWVAGLVNAFPEESLRLWKLARGGRLKQALALYRWFMPALHLDSDVKLVQAIKLAQAMAGHGSEMVRQPRLPLAGEERRRVAATIEAALRSRAQQAAE